MTDPLLARAAPGSEVGPWTVPVKATTLDRLAAAAGITPEAAGPALAGNLCVGLLFRILPRHVLHTRQVVTAHGTVSSGDELVAHARVTAVTARRGRAYVAIAGDVRRDGDLLWEVEAECVVPGAEAAGLPEVGRPALALPDAAATATTTRVLTLEDQASFSGRGNFHSDPEVARVTGYDRPVAQGLHLAAVGFPLLAPHWPGTGTLEVRFTGLAFPGDTVVAAALPDGPCTWLRVRAGDDVVVAGRYARELSAAPPPAAV